MSNTPCTVCAPVAPKRPTISCRVNTRTGTCVKRIGYISCASAVDVFALVGQSESAVYTAFNAMLAVSPSVIGYTGLLMATEFVDPQLITEQTAECLPAFETPGTRDITFTDYNGYDVQTSGGTITNPYWEYDMYDTLNKNGSNYYFFHVDCNNDLWLYYKSVNGTIRPVATSFYAFKTNEKKQAGNNSICTQIIKGKISFIGDPINFSVKPLVNISNATGLLANLL